MATHLDIIKRVLRRLREDEVSSSTETDYGQLISEFVKEGFEIVMEAHNWEIFNTHLKIDMTASTVEYRLDETTAQSGDVRVGTDVFTRDTELNWWAANAVPMAFVFNVGVEDEYKSLPRFASPQEIRRLRRSDQSQGSEWPAYFTVYDDHSNGSWQAKLEIWPEPDSAKVFQLDHWTPQATLESDDTTDSTEILIPDRPVYLYALMMALNERGEEIGEPGNVAEQNYVSALERAIERDLQLYSRANRYDWSRD